MSSDHLDKLHTIAQKIQSFQPERQLVQLLIDVYWDCLEYIKVTLEGESNLNNVPVLTGPPAAPFASTCGDYIKAIWPNSPWDLLALLVAAAERHATQTLHSAEGASRKIVQGKHLWPCQRALDFMVRG
jgi:hypothetical protein